MRPVRLTLAAAVVLAVAACADRAEPAGAPSAAGAGSAAAVTLPPLEHDFGVLAHGTWATHDIPVDLTHLPGPYVPLRAQLDCSCGRAQLVLRDPAGRERETDGSPYAMNLPAPGDTLLVRVTIDTRAKDPADLPKTTSRGMVVLQPPHDRDGSQRVLWPMLLHFGIDAPVELSPFAAFDFAAVPESARPRLRTTLRGDAAHRGASFGPASSNVAGLGAVLEPPAGGGAGVDVVISVEPRGLGSHAGVVSIATDIPDYTVHIAVRWKVVPDLAALPMAKISFRADLSRAQTEAEAVPQFVLVVDHDHGRTPEFAVHEVVSHDGRDAAASFAVGLSPVPGSRQRRLEVRYLGGQPNGFRGRIVLTKPGAAGPLLPIELVVFAK